MPRLASFDVQGDFAEESLEMRARTCRSVAARIGPISTAFMILLSFSTAHSQDVSVTRLPVDTDMTVRLTNLTSHVNYDRGGDS
jgi:hypothetical protein